MKRSSDKVVRAIHITCEITGAKYSTDVMDLMQAELAHHSEHQVLQALRLCCRECQYPVKLADIIQRIPRAVDQFIERRIREDRESMDREIARVDAGMQRRIRAGEFRQIEGRMS